MTDSPPSQPSPSAKAIPVAQPGWWGRQTLLTRLLLISIGLLILSGYLVSKDLNRLAPNFDGATGWINTPSLQSGDLDGKIVLVDFWTLSCINCIRTFPYLKAWDEKYRDQGLVIVGVHTPEFAFEHAEGRVKDAVAQFGLLMDVGVEVKAVVGSRELPLQTVLAIHPGTILELERMAGEPIELQVNGKPIARAEVVVIEGRLGARILEMLPAGSP